MPIDGEPPWLALYRAETERLRVLTEFFMHDSVRGDTADEVGTIILDIAGRSAVRDFVPAWLNREHVA